VRGAVEVDAGAAVDSYTPDVRAGTDEAENGPEFDVNGNPNGWLVVARNAGSLSHDVFITVSCVKPTSVTGLGATTANRAAKAEQLARK
jgi:hypothetical protein